MAVECPRFECSGHVEPTSYDTPARCPNGHRLQLVRDRVQEFFDRATSGANA